MKKAFNNPAERGLIIILSAVIILIIAVLMFTPADNQEHHASSAEQKLENLSAEVLQSIENAFTLNGTEEYSEAFGGSSWKNRGLSFYVCDNNQIVYWSDNEPAIDNFTLTSLQNGELLHLRNGDFLTYVIQKNSKKILSLLLIKHNYDYENKYLVNNFNPALGFGPGYKLSSEGDTLHIPNTSQYYIISKDPLNVNQSSLLISMYALIVLLLMVSVYLILRLFFLRGWKQALRFVLLVSGLRILMIWFQVPSELYRHPVFSPLNYASSFFFNSLGDLLLNVILLILFSLTFYDNVRLYKWKKIWIIVICVFAACIAHILIRGLVINSSISFELSRPEDINIFSILGFTSVSLILLCFLVLVSGAMKIFSGYKITGRYALTAISICSLYGAFALSSMNQEKENETRKLLAQKAVMRQDHISEFIFSDQQKKIQNDDQISEIAESGKDVNSRITSYITQRYFSGYLSKFEVDAELLRIAPEENYLAAAKEYFNSVPENAYKTGTEGLFFLKNETGRSSYLEIIPLDSSPDKKWFLKLQMNLRFLHSEKGFPELFISGNQTDVLPSDDYSLARYTSGSLVYEYGEYVYPLTAKEFPSGQSEFVFFGLNKYNHLRYNIDANSFVLISKPETTSAGFLTLFSWTFTFMSVLAFAIALLSATIQKEGLRLNLTRRVQGAVIFLIVLTFILVGYGTVYYINHKYRDDQRRIISDQVNALWFMISDNIYSGEKNNTDSITERQQLDRLVNNTNIDFNIYGSDGNVFYSSQPDIFNKGIISGRMNPSAYFKIKEHGLTQYIHPESAGKLKFIAGYAPFTDRSGNITGYLNLPYFEKQNELNKEVSVFLSALVNIYVLLFALAVLLTIFITSQITKPLLLIRERMSGIRLGETNEKIGYADNDEIGQLVNEYNRMIDELSISAEKLAKGERESAWREMARQVAHEIKNPLTPMKLSVQHLQRAYKEKGNNDEGFVDRISATLIQQIDTLSNIATAFSNFAKMPQPIISRLDLRELLSDLVELYKESTAVELISDEELYPVLADRDQMIGIFSNLLKNAAQSIPSERPGRIEVILKREGGWVTVQIRDNGIGIPESQRDKIFIPNFTTKSSGMGLGLAIVRNIVEEASGKIWFTSTYDLGSSFFVSLPESA